MQRFLVRRFIVSIITILAVSLIIFVMSRAAGDPRALMLDDYSTQADYERLGRELGLNKPYYQQYGIFLLDSLQGKFGESIHEGRPTLQIILERLPATIYLGVAAFAFSIIVGVPLGILSAVKRGSLVDQFGKVIALVGQSAPPFWLGIMLMFLFSVELDLLPTSGREGPLSVILPAVTLGWFYTAANVRLLRSSLLDVLDSEYIKLARAKGVSPRVIIVKHALRNAVIVPLTFAGITLGALVTGSLVVETVFAWPGLGKLAVDALFLLDYPVLQGVVIVFTLLYVAAAFLVDVLYAYIDPRIRYT